MGMDYGCPDCGGSHYWLRACDEPPLPWFFDAPRSGKNMRPICESCGQPHDPIRTPCIFGEGASDDSTRIEDPNAGRDMSVLPEGEGRDPDAMPPDTPVPDETGD
jgi:hypothetical protein